MAREVGRLSAVKVSHAKEPGYYPDGAGLYLQVNKVTSKSADGANGAAVTKSWIFRYTIDGCSREMGLGPLGTVSLADARQKAADARKLKLEGIDPIEARKAAKAAARAAEASTVTFQEAAGRYIEAHATTWRNEKHAAQWKSTLATYVYPVFGGATARAVDTGMVLKALNPIWAKKPETANRVRGRIEAVLDWAKAREYREGDNPARLDGHLKYLLPKRVKQVRHHPALPYVNAASFVATVRAQEGTAARALEFVILTAVRTSEAIEAKWAEIDFDAATWTIPADRTKTRNEHRVPLAVAAVAILRAQRAQQRETGYKGEYVFPGDKAGRSLSNMAMLALLRRMGRDDLTVHGFRSTFRDWAAERTSYPREVAEQALAHAIGDKVEAAYRRGDLFEKRRRLMDEWAKFCAQTKRAGEVVALNRTH